MTGRSSTVFVLVALSGILAVAGCSGSKKGFTLKGSVSCQGKPLPSGVVRLHMGDNRMAMATIQSDGSFEVTEVFPGEAKVTVEEIKKIRRVGLLGRKKKPSVPIPPKYETANTTDLVFTLVSGQTLEIKLE